MSQSKASNMVNSLRAQVASGKIDTAKGKTKVKRRMDNYVVGGIKCF